jgi:internalin A
MSALALKLIQEAKEQRLTRLDLGNCGLTELPDELFELVWLEELILSSSAVFYDFEKMI